MTLSRRPTRIDPHELIVRSFEQFLYAELAPLIERTFRYVYMLTTLRRDELIRDGRGD